jgi:hypothetical protein
VLQAWQAVTVAWCGEMEKRKPSKPLSDLQLSSAQTTTPAILQHT